MPTPGLIDAIKQAWGPEDDFDFNGQFIKLAKVRAKPKPTAAPGR